MDDMKSLVLLAVFVPAIAHAQAPVVDQPIAPIPVAPPPEGASPPAAEPPRQLSMVERLTNSARGAARIGHCSKLPMIGERVREIDPVYFANVFAVDPEITNCSAAPGMTQPSMTGQPVSDADAVPTGEYKSPGTALLISLGVTAGGYGLVALADAHHSSSGGSNPLATVGAIAALVGPSLGHTYAGRTWNTGLGVRLVGAGSAVLGAVMVVSDSCFLADGPCQSNGNADLGGVLLVGGGLLYIGGTIYEIATAYSAAEDYNHAHHLDAKLTFAPVRTTTGTAPGLAFVGRF